MANLSWRGGDRFLQLFSLDNLDMNGLVLQTLAAARCRHSNRLYRLFLHWFGAVSISASRFLCAYFGCQQQECHDEYMAQAVNERLFHTRQSLYESARAPRWE